MNHDSMCDGCGGLLPPPDATGHVTCQSCGRVTRAPDPVIEPPAEKVVDFSTWTPGPGGSSDFAGVSTVDLSTATAKAVRTGGIGCGIGSVVVLIGLIVAIGAVVIAVRNGIDSVTKVTDTIGASGSSRYYPDGGSAIVIPGGEGGTTDLVLLASDNKDDSRRKLVRVQLADDSSKVMWASEPFASDVYDVEMAFTGDDLYVGAKDEVRLLSLATGDVAWKTTLTDKISTGCSTCFATAGGKLVVRTDDAYLTGLGPASPEQLWSKRLTSIGAKPSVVGDRVLVVDEVKGQDAQVQTIDPATGKVTSTITPKCAPPDGQYYPVTMSPGNRVFGVPASGDLVTAFGFSGGCVVRWEAATNTVRWATYTGDMTPGNDSPPIISARDLVFGGSNGMVHIDMGTGRPAELPPVADASSSPRALVGRTLLADTTTTRGTDKAGIGAWDLNTNTHLWTTPLPRGSQPASDDEYRSSDALFDGSPRSVLVLGGTQPRVVTFTGEGRTFTDQTIDMVTGNLSQPVKEPYESRNGGSGTPSLTVEDVIANRLVVSIDGLLQVVPVGGDGAVIRWPG